MAYRYADDVSVPEAGTGNIAHDDHCGLHGDPFGLGAVKGGLGLLTRSGSRKRLSPGSLMARTDAAVPEDGVLAKGITGDTMFPAMLIGYQSCPGFDRCPQSFRMPPRLRESSGERGANRAAAGAVTRAGGRSIKTSTRAELPDQRLSPEPEAVSHEVPVLAPTQVDTATLLTATTAASAFEASATSAGHSPSSPLPLRTVPFSELLSGPGFSYAAGGDGVFETNEISLGSLASGSLGSCGYMLEGDESDDGEYGDDGSEVDSAKFSPVGIVCSGRGKHLESAAAIAAAAAAAAPAVAGAVTPTPELFSTDQIYGVLKPLTVAFEGGLQVDTGVTAAAAVTAVGAQPRYTPAVAAARSSSGPLGRTDGAARVCVAGDVRKLGLSSEEQEVLGDSLPQWSCSCESVGSADGSNCEIPSLNSRAQAAVAGTGGAGAWPAAGYGGGDTTTGGAHACLDGAAVFGIGGFVLRPNMAAAADALGNGTEAGGDVAVDAAGGAWLSVGGPHELNVLLPPTVGRKGAATTAANATLPLTEAPPTLLPPEIYLGFVTQLVESVRTAARAVDEAERKGGLGYAHEGYY